MATYNLSKFGRFYIATEEQEELSTIRLSFVGITLVLGLTVVSIILRHFVRLLKDVKKSSTGFKIQFPLVRIQATYLIFLSSYIIHTLHYADNIARPVAYFEPSYLYKRYFLETMEITFFVNFPISLLGLISLINLITLDDRVGQVIISRRCIFGLYGYAVGSLLTLGHYRIEPPTSYSWEVNFTIAGEGLYTVILIFLVYCWFHKKSEHDSGNVYQPVHQKDFEDSKEEMMENAIYPNVVRRSPKITKGK